MPAIGDSASLSKTITAEDIEQFANLTLDVNPVHVDAEYAKNSIFGRPVAHGTYLLGLVGAVLANELPGPGTIAVELASKFQAPAFVGDTVTATVTVVGSPRTNWYEMEAAVTNEGGETLATGSMLVLFAGRSLG